MPIWLQTLLSESVLRVHVCASVGLRVFVCVHVAVSALALHPLCYYPVCRNLLYTHTHTHKHTHTTHTSVKSHSLLIIRVLVQPALFIMNGAYLSGVISTNDYGKTFRQQQAFKNICSLWLIKFGSCISIVFIVSHFQEYRLMTSNICCHRSKRTLCFSSPPVSHFLSPTVQQSLCGN